jgi:hypothetical protein
VSLVRLRPGLIFPVERLEVAGMVFREVSVIEIREVLRAWLAGKSERAVAAQAGDERAFCGGAFLSGEKARLAWL